MAFKGRSTLFAVWFAVNGTALAWCNKLTVTFVSLATAIHGFVVAHSYKEGVEEKNAQALNQDANDHHN
jgi:hypothetical protein